jgi:zinc transporter 1/2/3
LGWCCTRKPAPWLAFKRRGGELTRSIIIGLTLSTNEDFIVLFVVIIFHQMFEGLGLGSRLAVLRLPPQHAWIRYAAAVLYSVCTPIGMAAGLGAISSFNGNSAQANLATGVLDAFSAGILLYTGEWCAGAIVDTLSCLAAAPMEVP